MSPTPPAVTARDQQAAPVGPYGSGADHQPLACQDGHHDQCGGCQAESIIACRPRRSRPGAGRVRPAGAVACSAAPPFGAGGGLLASTSNGWCPRSRRAGVRGSRQASAADTLSHPRCHGNGPVGRPARQVVLRTLRTRRSSDRHFSDTTPLDVLAQQTAPAPRRAAGTYGSGWTHPRPDAGARLRPRLQAMIARLAARRTDMVSIWAGHPVMISRGPPYWPTWCAACWRGLVTAGGVGSLTPRCSPGTKSAPWSWGGVSQCGRPDEPPCCSPPTPARRCWSVLALLVLILGVAHAVFWCCVRSASRCSLASGGRRGRRSAWTLLADRTLSWFGDLW